MVQAIIYDDEHDIVAFWQRLPKFFLFPFHTEPLLYTLLLSASALLVPLLDPWLPDDFALLIVESGIWLAALRYAFRVLQQTALGFLTPDQYRQASDAQDASLPYKLLGVLFVWGAISGAVAKLSDTLGVLVDLFTALALPASIMGLAVTQSLAQGLSPARWVAVMRSIGKPYLILWFFLSLLFGGGGIGFELLRPVMADWLLLPLANLAFLYFNLIMFNMMGYCLYQYHRQLGLEVEVAYAASRDGRPGAAQTGKPSDAIADDIARLIAAGDMKGALDRAYESQRLAADDLAAQDRYHRLLLLMPDKRDATLSHGQRYLALLLRKAQSERALEVFKSCRGLREDFEPAEPGQILQLAHAARRRRDFKLALALVRDFDQRHPRHPDVPAAYMLSAQIFSENFKKDELARLILQGLLQKFPGHALAADADIYLRTLDRIAKQSVT